jgi:hypothetical protein
LPTRQDRELLNYFRGDAAYILNREIEQLTIRPVGRQPRAPVILYLDNGNVANFGQAAKAILSKCRTAAAQEVPEITIA